MLLLSIICYRKENISYLIKIFQMWEKLRQLIACGLILPSCWVPLGRVSYQQGNPVKFQCIKGFLITTLQHQPLIPKHPRPFQHPAPPLHFPCTQPSLILLSIFGWTAYYHKKTNVFGMVSISISISSFTQGLSIINIVFKRQIMWQRYAPYYIRICDKTIPSHILLGCHIGRHKLRQAGKNWCPKTSSVALRTYHLPPQNVNFLTKISTKKLVSQNFFCCSQNLPKHILVFKKSILKPPFIVCKLFLNVKFGVDPTQKILEKVYILDFFCTLS